MDARSQKLKETILKKYPSIRAFAREAGIAHGTLVSAINKGIDGMAWVKLNRICRILEIDAATLEPVYAETAGMREDEKRLLAYYNMLNHDGQAKVEAYVKDMGMIAVYGDRKA